MHFSQIPPSIETVIGDSAPLLLVRARGMLDSETIRRELRQWSTRFAGGFPPCVLIDVRDVAGYTAGCIVLAREWLLRAPALGIRRVALVGTSSVFTAALRVLERGAGIALRSFANEPAARAWLARDHHERVESSAASLL